MKGSGKALCGSVLFILTCGPTLTLGGQLSNDSSERELLQKEIGRVDLKQGMLIYAVERTLTAANVPDGVAVVHGCEGEPSRDLPVFGPTLRDALTAIQKVAPDYKWHVTGGVVNVAPRGGFPPLLRTYLREFDSKDASNLTWAASLLIGAPEVGEAKSRLGFIEAPNEIEVGLGMGPKNGTPPAPRERPLAVRCQGCTISEALNAMVRARGHGLWVYDERHCGGISTFHIAFSD